MARRRSYPDLGPRVPAQGRLVLAHYHFPFPRSIEDDQSRTPLALGGGGDSYDDWAHGYGSDGGYLCDRPTPRLAGSTSTAFQVRDLAVKEFRLEDARRDVALARSMGIGGFQFNLGVREEDDRYGYMTFLAVLRAADERNGAFKLLLSPDMSGGVYSGLSGGDCAALIRRNVLDLYGHASNLLIDGRVVLAPYDADRRSPDFWRGLIDSLDAEGHGIAIVPMTQIDVSRQRWADGMGEARASAGTMFWGSPGGTRGVRCFTTFGADFRPASRRLDDFMGAGRLRDQWAEAIRARADWVNIGTWNDFSEGHQVQPSVDLGWSMGALVRHYAAIFRTGSAPAYGRPLVAWFQKIQSVSPVPTGWIVDGGADRLFVSVLGAPQGATARIGTGPDVPLVDDGFGVRSADLTRTVGPAASAVVTIGGKATAFDVPALGPVDPARPDWAYRGGLLRAA